MLRTWILKIQNLEISPNSPVQIGIDCLCNIPTLHRSTPYNQKLAKFKFNSKCPLGHCALAGKTFFLIIFCHIFLPWPII